MHDKVEIMRFLLRRYDLNTVDYKRLFKKVEDIWVQQQQAKGIHPFYIFPYYIGKNGIKL